MATIEVGSSIKRLRVQKGITQANLARNIMDISTLSRIERGLIMPSKYMIEALFSRLGFDPNKIAHFFMTGDDVQFQKIFDEIDTAIGYRKADELKALIAQLEGSERHMEQSIMRQFAMYARGTLELIEGFRSAALETLNHAIKITLPDFKKDLIPDYLLTHLDRRIIITMAVLEKNMGNIEDAVYLYYGIKSNFDNHVVDRVDFGRNYSTVLFNLVICLTELKRFEEALSMCLECKKICIETGFGFVLPSITCYEAIARHELKMDGCEELFKQSYYGCVLFELHKDSEFVKKVAKDRLGLKLG